MHRAHRYLASLFLIAAIAAPLSLIAVPAPQEASVQVRVYDKEHKDYHTWDDNENRSWVQYQTDNHKTQQDFSKANSKEQSQYWNFRHKHPDNN
jgi:hypothetical protein